MSVAQVLFELLRGASLTEGPDWQSVLEFADRTQLSLYLRGCPHLPVWMQSEIEARFGRNALRRKRLQEAFLEIQQKMDGLPFLMLKGFTHETGFGLTPGCRVQYDLDLLVKPEHAQEAASVLEDLGYRPHGEASLSDEHGRPWVRPSTWAWLGDYFDPNMPIAVELHDTVWSEKRDHIECPETDQFWERTCILDIAGVRVPALGELDRVAFAALHALRHILRNDARLAPVWELASLLRTRADDSEFWTRWRQQDESFRRLQTVAFRFAQEWFVCRLPEAVATECEDLPASVKQWFQEFAWSPVENLNGANKNVVWLHLALLSGWRERLGVLQERLLPLRLPHGQEASEYSTQLHSRLRYHAAAFVPVLRDGVRLWRRTASSTVAHRSD